MNFSPPSHGRGSRKPLWGWCISILVHALALAWLVRNPPVQPPRELPQRRSTLVMVELQRPAPATTERTHVADAHVADAHVADAHVADAHVADAHVAGVHATKPVRAVRPAQSLPRLFVPPVPAESAQADPPRSAPADGTAETEPVFDMEAARMAIRAGNGAGTGRNGIASERASRGPGALEATRDEKLGKAIERSRRSDCQTQYAGMGLLAVIPLVKDTVTGTGCKWN